MFHTLIKTLKTPNVEHFRHRLHNFQFETLSNNAVIKLIASLVTTKCNYMERVNL